MGIVPTTAKSGALTTTLTCQSDLYTIIYLTQSIGQNRSGRHDYTILKTYPITNRNKIIHGLHIHTHLRLWVHKSLQKLYAAIDCKYWGKLHRKRSAIENQFGNYISVGESSFRFTPHLAVQFTESFEKCSRSDVVGELDPKR